MNTPVRTLLAYLHRLIEYAAFYGVLFTLAGLFDRHHWFLGLFTHLKLPLAGCFIGYTLIELVARHRHHVAAGVIFARERIAGADALSACPASAAADCARDGCATRIFTGDIPPATATPPRCSASLTAKRRRSCSGDGRRGWATSRSDQRYPVFAAMPRGITGCRHFLQVPDRCDTAYCPCRHLQSPLPPGVARHLARGCGTASARVSWADAHARQRSSA